jgi:hypothetical protein
MAATVAAQGHQRDAGAEVLAGGGVDLRCRGVEQAADDSVDKRGEAAANL